MLNATESMHNLRGIRARFQRNPCTKPAVSMHGMGGIFKESVYARPTYTVEYQRVRYDGVPY